MSLEVLQSKDQSSSVAETFVAIDEKNVHAEIAMQALQRIRTTMGLPEVEDENVPVLGDAHKQWLGKIVSPEEVERVASLPLEERLALAFRINTYMEAVKIKRLTPQAQTRRAEYLLHYFSGKTHIEIAEMYGVRKDSASDVLKYLAGSIIKNIPEEALDTILAGDMPELPAPRPRRSKKSSQAKPTKVTAATTYEYDEEVTQTVYPRLYLLDDPEEVEKQIDEEAVATEQSLPAQILSTGRRTARSSKKDLLSPEQVVELAKRIEKGDLAAKKELIEKNRGLVYSVAKTYHPIESMTDEDIRQNGMLGLIRAAEKFDWRRGYQFSTYATIWIRQAIQREGDKQAKFLRAPVSIAQKERRLRSLSHEFLQQHRREPTAEELAELSDIPVGKVEKIQEMNQTPASLDKKVGDDESGTLGSLLPSRTPTPEQQVIKGSASAVLAQALRELPEQQRLFVEDHYGMSGEGEMSMRQIARKYKVKESEVKKAHDAALDLLEAQLSADQNLLLTA